MYTISWEGLPLGPLKEFLPIPSNLPDWNKMTPEQQLLRVTVAVVVELVARPPMSTRRLETLVGVMKQFVYAADQSLLAQQQQLNNTTES